MVHGAWCMVHGAVHFALAGVWRRNEPDLVAEKLLHCLPWARAGYAVHLQRTLRLLDARWFLDFNGPCLPMPEEYRKSCQRC